jgi:hypothetical protein
LAAALSGVVAILIFFPAPPGNFSELLFLKGLPACLPSPPLIRSTEPITGMSPSFVVAAVEPFRVSLVNLRRRIGAVNTSSRCCPESHALFD